MKMPQKPQDEVLRSITTLLQHHDYCNSTTVHLSTTCIDATSSTTPEDPIPSPLISLPGATSSPRVQSNAILDHRQLPPTLIPNMPPQLHICAGTYAESRWLVTNDAVFCNNLVMTLICFID